MIVAVIRLEEIDWEGVIAQAKGQSVDKNPHPEYSEEWWMWRLAFMREQQAQEYEASLPRQVERQIEEQSRWELREKTGINELVNRIKRRADMLGNLFASRAVPGILLEMHRRLLRESVHDLLSRVPDGC